MAIQDFGGLLFGGGGTGLEDYLSADQQSGIRNQAMLQAAAALLQAGGPSRQPISLGQALGGALQAGAGGYQQAQQGAIQTLLTRQKLSEAKRQAVENEMDLVEIVPNAEPPVVRVMDVGKFLFEQNKKRHAAKKKQKQIQIKEIKLRPGTDDGDYDIKVRNIRRFLEEGDKVKITLRFRGREMAHQELGAQMLKRVEADLGVLAVVEQYARMEGRQMVMMVAPKRH
jgi:translation initiation factor IF-3